MGKASFIEVQDFQGGTQVYLNREAICPGEDKSMYNEVFKKLLDIGDHIGISGKVFKTRVGGDFCDGKGFKATLKIITTITAAKN